MNKQRFRWNKLILAVITVISLSLSSGCVPVDAVGIETFFWDLLRSAAAALL
ncbi:MAG: hypothetical protein ACYTA5_26030 [Planctomycetota bacterium]|jgi:hypothetical protein